MVRRPDDLTADEQIGLEQVPASCGYLEVTAAEMLTEGLSKNLA